MTTADRWLPLLRGSSYGLGGWQIGRIRFAELIERTQLPIPIRLYVSIDPVRPHTAAITKLRISDLGVIEGLLSDPGDRLRSQLVGRTVAAMPSFWYSSVTDSVAGLVDVGLINANTASSESPIWRPELWQ